MENYENSSIIQINVSQTSSSPMSFSKSTQEDIQSEIIADNQNRSSFYSVTEIGLRSVEEIPIEYRHIFSQYPSFNAFQSKVLDTVLYHDTSVVVSAPTGSGKTVVFELAIVNLLSKINNLKHNEDFMIVYMAPMKALCAERMRDWINKFSSLGLTCEEVTGDTDPNLNEISKINIVFTTPEKWDSLTRSWKDNKKIVETIKLFLLDEVHLLNDEKRGPVLEAVVSRMKTIQETLSYSTNQENKLSRFEHPLSIRFIAVSATIPNIEDVAVWLGKPNQPAKYFKLGEEFRPVKLQKVVIGYQCPEDKSLYRFELQLNYKLRQILFQYSEGKPSIIFCSTRKGVMQTADTLRKQITFHFNNEQKMQISNALSNIKENAVKKSIEAGIGCHHAGMDINDRKVIEDLFRSEGLPVLITTSTLSMGVNLPAHLVIIKSTQQYTSNGYEEYSSNQILQMIGRAGRPQYDTHGTAVIMTHQEKTEKYRRLVTGTDVLESSLHRHLAEHLNSEIVLSTITEKAVAINWIRSTFLYVRALNNPTHYGISANLNKEKIEDKLQEMCMIEMNSLANYNIVKMDIMDVYPTNIGKLMAQHYMSFETMKNLTKINGKENLSDMLQIIVNCNEFLDCKLRTSDKRSLNFLNKSIRFPIPGLIKTQKMKINCLVQAMFGGLMIPEPSLQQECVQIIRIGKRVTKCLTKYLSMQDNFRSLLSAVILEKCFQSNLWENSPFVSRQLTGIGAVLSQLLVSAGKNSFQSIADSNPRDLERIINRAPPIGNRLKEAASHMPQYSIEVTKTTTQLNLKIVLNNYEEINNFSTPGSNHSLAIIAGDSNNKLLLYTRFHDSLLLNNGGSYTWCIEIVNNTSNQIYIHLISEKWVGMDQNAIIDLKSEFIQKLCNINKSPKNNNTTQKVSGKSEQRNKKNKVRKQTKNKNSSVLNRMNKDYSNFSNSLGTKKIRLNTERKTVQVNIKDYLFTPKQKEKLTPLSHYKNQQEKNISSVLCNKSNYFETDKKSCMDETLINPKATNENLNTESIDDSKIATNEEELNSFLSPIKTHPSPKIKEIKACDQFENIGNSFVKIQNAHRDICNNNIEYSSNDLLKNSSGCLSLSNKNFSNYRSVNEEDHQIEPANIICTQITECIESDSSQNENNSFPESIINYSNQNKSDEFAISEAEKYETKLNSHFDPGSPSSICSLATVIIPHKLENCSQEIDNEENNLIVPKECEQNNFTKVNSIQKTSEDYEEFILVSCDTMGQANNRDHEILEIMSEEYDNKCALNKNEQDNMNQKRNVNNTPTDHSVFHKISEYTSPKNCTSKINDFSLCEKANLMGNNEGFTHDKCNIEELFKLKTNKSKDLVTLSKKCCQSSVLLYSSSEYFSDNESSDKLLKTKGTNFNQNYNTTNSDGYITISDYKLSSYKSSPLQYLARNSQKQIISNFKIEKNNSEQDLVNFNAGSSFTNKGHVSASLSNTLEFKEINAKYKPIFQKQICQPQLNQLNTEENIRDANLTISLNQISNTSCCLNTIQNITFDIGINELLLDEEEEILVENSPKVYTNLHIAKHLGSNKRNVDFSNPINKILYGDICKTQNEDKKYPSYENISKLSNETEKRNSKSNFIPTCRDANSDDNAKLSFNKILESNEERDKQDYITNSSELNFENTLLKNNGDEFQSFISSTASSLSRGTLNAFEFLQNSNDPCFSPFVHNLPCQKSCEYDDVEDIFEGTENNDFPNKLCDNNSQKDIFIESCVSPFQKRLFTRTDRKVDLPSSRVFVNSMESL